MCACNGRYYGGGFNPIPEAIPNDGIMDVLLVKKISRVQVISLIGKYASGRYRELGEMVIRLNVRELEISSPEQFVINVDGESIWSDSARFRIIQNGINMIFPLGTSYFG
jgi:diacylglycerol kinase (ATP)